MRPLLVLALLSPAWLAAQTVVLENGTVLDGTGAPAQSHRTIVIQNGKIRAITSAPPNKIPARATVRHLDGKFVVPGLINGHGHLGLVENGAAPPDAYTEPNITRQLRMYERYGVTTVMSLGMNKDLLYRLMEEQRIGDLAGATILTADRGVGVPGGVPAVPVGPDQLYRPATVDEARQDVREMAAREPNLVKIWVDTNLNKLPAPNPAIAAAVIDEAHKHHLRVAAHVFYLADARRLIDAGVDILAHSIRDLPVDPDTLASLKKHNVFYIPTLQLEESFYVYADHPAWMDLPFFRDAVSPSLWAALNAPAYKAKVDADKTTPVHRAAFQMALENLKRVYDAGVSVGFGTDSGANPNRIQGFAEHRELQLYVAAGLTPSQAIRCATEGSARMLAILGATGTITTGKDADLVVLDDDPTANIANTEKIAFVVHGTRLIPRN